MVHPRRLSELMHTAPAAGTKATMLDMLFMARRRVLDRVIPHPFVMAAWALAGFLFWIFGVLGSFDF